MNNLSSCVTWLTWLSKALRGTQKIVFGGANCTGTRTHKTERLHTMKTYENESEKSSAGVGIVRSNISTCVANKFGDCSPNKKPTLCHTAATEEEIFVNGATVLRLYSVQHCLSCRSVEVALQQKVLHRFGANSAEACFVYPGKQP